MKQVMRVSAVITFLIALFSQSVMADTTLRFAWWGGDSRHKPTLQAIKLFEAKNPGVVIKGEYMGFDGYSERLLTQIAGSTEPDIMQLNWAWVPAQFSKSGETFFDLYKAKGSINLTAFGDLIKSCEIRGKLNSIPVSNTARFFFWQKNVFDKAGIPFPKTWDELFADGKIFEQKLGKDYYPIDGMLYDVINLSQSYMLQKTGKFWIDPKTPRVAYTKAEALEFVKIYKKFTQSHVVIPLDQRLSLATQETPTEQFNEWYTGKWAGIYIWDSTFLQRITPLPKTTVCDVSSFLTMKGAKNSGYFSRPAMVLAVSRHSKNPLLAAKFIDFMLNDPEGIRALGTSRGAPSSKIGYDLLVKENRFLPVEKKASDQLRAAKVSVPSPFFEHNTIQQHVRMVCEQISMGKISDEEAARLLTVETDKILTRISK
jgi:oligogalacturonide transport system substrate-binding protein